MARVRELPQDWQMASATAGMPFLPRRAPTHRRRSLALSGREATNGSDAQSARSRPPSRPRGLGTTYPVRFSVEYPDRLLNRVTTAFRIFTVIAIVVGTIGGYGGQWAGGADTTTVAAGGAGLLFLPPLLMIVPPEVPPLVVRLEPPAAQIREPRRRLPRASW